MRVRMAEPGEKEWFDRVVEEHHELGAGKAVGDYLRQVVERRGVAVALLTWGPACYALKDRDLWIGWSATHRAERLKLVVQNRRFALLSAKGAEPNLASQSLAAALRAVPEHWHERFGYRPLLAETFSNPESHEGTCYKASNWIAVGTTAGYARHRADRYIRNDSPKKLWLYSLHPEAKRHLCAVKVPAECARAMGPAATGTLPLREPQMESLWECLCGVPDPRSRNARFRIGSILTIIAMALLAGCSPGFVITEPVRPSASPQPRCSLRFALPRQKTLRPGPLGRSTYIRCRVRRPRRVSPDSSTRRVRAQSKRRRARTEGSSTKTLSAA